jgi:RNase H-like domain found in reverse transcriptase
MAHSKVDAIQEWPTPASVKALQQFLGFANFHRRFINGYSRTITPLTRLFKKDAKFHWENQADTAFITLKLAFTSEPVLQHFDPNLDTIAETDASDFAISAILSPLHEDRLHPIAFMSRKMAPPS